MAHSASPLRDYIQLIRLDRPVGIWLLLWPTLWALWWAAEGWPPWPVLTVFVLGTVLMRSAGCAINDVADRKVDPHVRRTADRPIAAGRLTARQGVVTAVLLALVALLLLMSLRSPLAVAWSVPAVLLAAVYPLMKRVIDLPQAVLGLAFSWGMPMAWAVLQGTVPVWPVALLMAANVAWVIAYDTYYAMADREDDARIGVRSSARWFGRHDRAVVLSLNLLALVLLASVGRTAGFGPAYFGGLVVALGLMAAAHWQTRRRDPQACFAAFKRSHWQGAAIWLGLVLEFGSTAA
ncbi:4-hydroxybenzoate octaprenyltransferase [Flagellatimonas centrodinii]|uniref:4-hydroxybenzoate octaprenyltransferase n=1 Tax=Flagellatimonas centrodinii TaxID=2806210 RepID=UPI001FEFA5EC|nr:4-hydroxybenzoate octaprenyltransferase [Flagellatimonas centrodinii]ULQ47161.1 4-hydroxybenzoate octaprenyltransferase [Flagellatimonas centrodinii]